MQCDFIRAGFFVGFFWWFFFTSISFASSSSSSFSSFSFSSVSYFHYSVSSCYDLFGEVDAKCGVPHSSVVSHTTLGVEDAFGLFIMHSSLYLCQLNSSYMLY